MRQIPSVAPVPGVAGVLHANARKRTNDYSLNISEIEP